MRNYARHVLLITIGVAALIASACGGSAPPPGEQAVSPVASIPSCTPGQDPNLGERARKDRIAKGVFRSSRRLAVDHEFEQWETPYGRWWVVADNFDTFSDVLAEQAVHVYGDEQRGVHSGDVVLDAGAHFGGFTRTALDRGARLIVSIDIAPENIEVLRRNYAQEIKDGRVIVYPKGVWDKDDTMVLERKNHTWADRVSTTGAGPTVAMTTIDKIVAELKLPRVDFIKMDIEGAERHALAGAIETIKQYQPRMAIATYHEPDDPQVLSGIVMGAKPEYTACFLGVGLGHGYLTTLFK